MQMVEFEKYTFQLCAVGYLWHLLNKHYLSTPAIPVLSLPFNLTSFWHPLMKVRGGFQMNTESELKLILSVSSLMENVE